MTTNKFGLSRYIPADVAFEVRKRSKFGCVVCRCAIYQYEHIDPQFADASSHEPENICLLCGGCHDRVTRGRLSKKTVRTHYENTQSDSEVRRPFEELDLSTTALSIALGSSTFNHSKALLRVNGEDILAINPAADGEAFPKLSGIFYDTTGCEIFRIRNNVWEGSIDAWDIEVVGTSITIKTAAGRIALRLVVSPPNHVAITNLDMYKDNCHLLCKDGELLVGQIHESGRTYIGLKNFQCQGAEAGVCVDSREGKAPKLVGIRMVGGEGILLDGTGIRVGVGAGQMCIGQLKIHSLMP